MKNKGFVSNKIVSAGVGKSIRVSKSTVGARVRGSKVSIDVTGTGTRVGEVVDKAINVVGMVVNLLEAARKVHLVGAIQITRTKPVLGLAEHVSPHTIAVAVGGRGVLKDVMGTDRVTHNALDRRNRMENRDIIDHRGGEQISLWTGEMLHRAFIS